MKTYKIKFTCSNCRKDFSERIPFGVEVKAHGPECPHCGSTKHFTY